MDETLLFAIDLQDDDPSKRTPLPGREVEFQVGDIIVYLRPHVREFLHRTSAVYDLAVWSSAGGHYVRSTISWLFDRFELPAPLFVWSSNKCTKKRDNELYYREYSVKNLKKVAKRGFDLQRMLIVDDSPEKCVANYGNAVYIKEFNGEPEDEELLHLAAYLESLAPVPNFRSVEKRGWRSRF
ncbi:MAG: phosphoprotein phosphatase [Cyanobacteria bacterium REEB67]|nr:phosphoprotein phosphatase [Cyanobacteria bacterium REEB67]